MRFLLRSVTAGTAWLACATALLAVPITVSLTPHGDWDPGTSGATADNSESLSTLSLRADTVIYQSAPQSVVLRPGDTVAVSLGTLSTIAGSEQPIAFDGARLNLTLSLDEPEVDVPFGALSADLAGAVGPNSEVLNLTWATPQDFTFLTADCVPKTITVTVEPVTSVVSGGPDVDIQATLSMATLDPLVVGDIDGSGTVDMIDVVRSLHMAGGMDSASCEELERADVDGNGSLDVLDSCSIARIVFGTA